MNITDPIRQHAESTPQALAVVRPDDSPISYVTLDRTVDLLASRIQAVGLRPGTIAALITTRPYRQLCLMLALARLGAGSVSPSLPADDLADHVDAWFVDEDGQVAAGRNVVAIDSLWPKDDQVVASAPPVPACADGSMVCGVFPTSGTTGTRRLVPVTHDMLCGRIARRASLLAPNEEIRRISTIGPGTKYGFLQRLEALWRGGTVVMAVQPDRILAAITRHQVTHLAVAPVSLQQLIGLVPAGTGPLPSLRQIEVGGAHLPQRLAALTRERLCANIFTQYGMTETGPVAGAPLASVEAVPGAVGYVYSGVEVQAVDEDGGVLPVGSEGSLRIRSPWLATSYLGQPDASAEAFRDGWFYSGDTGTVTPEGLLIVAGRTGEVINQGGDKVSPHEVEEVVLSVEGIEEAAAFGLPDNAGVERLWLAVVAKGPVDMPAMNALCRQRFRLGAPVSVMRLRALPRNDAGKVMRDELRRIATAVRAKKRTAAKSTH